MFTGIATWIAKSVLGGWLTKIGAAISWLFKAWYRIAIAVLLGVCVFLYVGKASALASAEKWKRTAEVELALRVANEKAYKAAQDTAADMNRKQVAVIKEQYDAIAQKSEIDYEKRIIANRAIVDKFLRSQANQRIAQSAGAGSAAQVQPEITGTGEMPVIPEGFILLPVSEAYMISAAYDKLAALQDAAKAVGDVNTEEVVIP